MGSNWDKIQFPIHWCRLHQWRQHQFCTLTVERSPLSALVTKLAFLVSIGWQPIVPPPACYDHDHRFNGFFFKSFPNQKRKQRVFGLQRASRGHFDKTLSNTEQPSKIEGYLDSMQRKSAPNSKIPISCGKGGWWDLVGKIPKIKEVFCFVCERL